MAKPTKHGDKWRIRWLDERGKRQSAVFDDYKRAQTELSRQQVEVEEIRRGVRNAAPPEKTFGDLCDYWIENRAPRKRSQSTDVPLRLPIDGHCRFFALGERDLSLETELLVNGDPKLLHLSAFVLGGESLHGTRNSIVRGFQRQLQLLHGVAHVGS